MGGRLFTSTLAGMRSSLFVAIVAASSGCATWPPLSSFAITRAQHVDESPRAREVPASTVDPALVVSDTDIVPPSRSLFTAARPITSSHSAFILPNWDPRDGNSVLSDPAGPPSAGDLLRDLVYRPDEPDLQAKVTTTDVTCRNVPSIIARQSEISGQR